MENIGGGGGRYRRGWRKGRKRNLKKRGEMR